MALKKLLKKKPKSKEELLSLSEEYRNLTEQEKFIQTRKKEIATILKEEAVNRGVPDSNTGSSYLDLGGYIIGNVIKRTVKINNERAKDLLESRGLWRLAISIKEVVDEEKLEQLVSDEKITEEELLSISDVRETPSISVKMQEINADMPEVTVSTIKKKKKK